MRNLLIASVFLLLFFSPNPAGSAESAWFPAEGVRALSGNTIVVRIQGEEKTVVLFGVDGLAPGQPHGEEAISFLQKFIAEKKLTLKEQRVAKSAAPMMGPWVLSGGRFVPVGGFLHGMFSTPETPPSKYIVRTAGKSLNQELLLAGLAWSSDPSMKPFSDAAKRKKTGLWADANRLRPKEWLAKTSAAKAE